MRVITNKARLHYLTWDGVVFIDLKSFREKMVKVKNYDGFNLSQPRSIEVNGFLYMIGGGPAGKYQSPSECYRLDESLGLWV